MILSDADARATRDDLASVVDTLTTKVAPRADVVTRAEAMADGRIDEALWRRLVDELGAVAMTAPESVGGAGAGIAEMAVYWESAGRHLTTVPLLGAWLGLETVVRAGAADNERLATLVDGWVEGREVVVVALPLELPRATEQDDGWRVHGELGLVVDAPQADHLVVPVALGDEVRWALVDREQARVEIRVGLDLTRSFADVALDGAVAVPLGETVDAAALRDVVRDLARLALACEQLGVAEQALADAVAHATQREQFGRPIGAFQAIAHLCADMATEADLARSLVEHAVWAGVEAPDELPRAAAMALDLASQAAVSVTAENVQVHGGIGFSWEYPAHLYFRKARSNAVLMGDRFALADAVLTDLVGAAP